MEGDVVIFSSRTIPGNDRAVDRIKNRFYAMGVNIITDRDAPVHVSGHPYRDELKQLYAWTKPKVILPVHGEAMQLEKHAALARECGVEETLIGANGKAVEITREGARFAGEVKSGILAIEGIRIVAVDHEAILTRKRMIWNGSAIVTAVVDRDGDLVADPKITALGLLDEGSEADSTYFDDVIALIKSKVKNMPRDHRRDDDELSEAIRVTTRRFFQENFDRKPQTRVHLVRV
jgi:ribonuclease J